MKIFSRCISIFYKSWYLGGFLQWPGLPKNPPAVQETWVGKIPWRRECYPVLQYSGLEDSMDCTVHEVAKSRTWLSDFHFLQWPNTRTCTTYWDKLSRPVKEAFLNIWSLSRIWFGGLRSFCFFPKCLEDSCAASVGWSWDLAVLE